MEENSFIYSPACRSGGSRTDAAHPEELDPTVTWAHDIMDKGWRNYVTKRLDRHLDRNKGRGPRMTMIHHMFEIAGPRQRRT